MLEYYICERFKDKLPLEFTLAMLDGPAMLVGPPAAWFLLHPQPKEDLCHVHLISKTAKIYHAVACQYNLQHMGYVEQDWQVT